MTPVSPARLAPALLAFALALSCTRLMALAPARTLHVDAGFDGSSSDGSVERPFRTIQAAVDAAAGKDTIKVAQGRYEDGNIDTKSKTLIFLGGFAGGSKAGKKGDFETRDPEKTPSIVVGSRETPDHKKNQAAVFYFSASAGGTVDGFTITGGRHGIYTGWSGSDEPLVIRNNVIEDNGVDKPGYDEHGGGVYSSYKNLILEKNVIRNNRSGRGGGVAAMGSGTARVEKNVIEGNVSLGDHGGGLFMAQNGVVRDNDIRKNQVVGELIHWMGGVGGGVIVLVAKVRLTENRITDNYAKKCGGGLFVDEGADVEMDHELIYGNRPAHKDGWGGSAIYVDGAVDKASKLRISFSTVAENAPAGPGDGNGIFVASLGEVTVENSIFWRNGQRAEFHVADPEKSYVQVSHTVFQGLGEGVRVGDGHHTADPLFADAAKGDFHLRSGAGRWDAAAGSGQGAWQLDTSTSPAIDAADPKAPFGREPAPNGARANLGRYGDTPFASKSASGQTGSSATPSPDPSASPADRLVAPDPSQPSGGGCAACGVAPSGSRGPGALWLATLGAALTRRLTRRSHPERVLRHG